MNINSPEVTLTQCMNEYYGELQWTKRTTAHTGTDIGPAMNVGLQAIRTNYGRGKFIIDPGNWRMETSPDKDLLSGNTIQGYGSQASLVFYDNNGGVAFWFSGAYSGGGMHGIGLLLEEGLGDTNAYGILLRGNATNQPDQMTFSDLYVTSAGGVSTWWNSFEISGQERTNPLGVRVVTLTQVQLFRARNIGLYINTGVQVSVINSGAYVGVGTYGNSVLVQNSSNVKLFNWVGAAYGATAVY